MGARDRDGLSLTVVGSGTASPEPDRVCSGYLVEAGPVRLLLDCGPGVVHHMARYGLPWQSLTHVAVTHFHNDHIGDLATLFFAWKHGMLPARSDDLDLIGPDGLARRLALLADALGDHVSEPGFRVRLGTPPAAPAELAPGVTLAAHPTRHTADSVAYRVTAPAGTVGYTGDTGYDEAVADFLADVDLLIMECSLPDDRAMAAHLTPTTAARMAARARPHTLLLTHVYPIMDRRALPDLVRSAGWDGPVRIARDGLRIRLPRVLARNGQNP